MIKAYFDGLCEPVNPGGVATYGYVIYRDDTKIVSGYGVIGAGMFGDETSNNIAEYYALIKLLEKIIELGIRGDIEIYGDSQLIINQVNGVYRVRSKKLKSLYEKTLELLSMLRNVRISWIPREMNKEADKLSYKAYIDFMHRYGKEAIKYYKRYLVTENQATMLKKLGIDANPYIPRRLFWRIYMQHKFQK
jgi:ribonuclease HI